MVTSASARPTILVVDDEVGILQLCERLLRGKFEVVTCASAEEGLELLDNTSCCTVIADQTLPGLSGNQMMHELQTRLPEVGRIVITGHATQEKAINAINEGSVHAYILKPWCAEEFVSTVEQVTELALLRIRLAEEHQRYQNLVLDRDCGLPTRALVEAQAADWLRKDGFIGVLVIDATDVWAAQTEVDAEKFVEIRRQFIDAVKALQGNQIRVEDVLAVDEVQSPCFCVLLSQPRSQRLSCARDLETIATRVLDAISAAVVAMEFPTGWPRVAVGHGFVLRNPAVPSTQQLRTAFLQARDRARRSLETDDQISGRSELERIIVDGLLRAVYQPIVSFCDLSRFGYEVLSRGPEGSPYEHPQVLLQLADRTGLSIELDLAFVRATIPAIETLPCGLAFINILPQTLCTVEMSAEQLRQSLDRLGIATNRLVLEFSERYVISNERTLQCHIDGYREMGIGLAIDDVGAGYSGLERIVRLQPGYLKIDISLVQGVASHAFKKSTIGALVGLAKDIGALTVAEGVETEPDLDCLRELGVDLGQGYLLGEVSCCGGSR